MSKDTSIPPLVAVINDNPTQLGILCGLVRQAGLEPRAFNGAEAALAGMDNANPPALIITDLYMPGIDGWRFCRLLRAPEYASFNQVPILVVSATFAGDEPERISAELGVEAFLSMPVNPTDFIEQIRTLLHGGRRSLPLRALILEDNPVLADLLGMAFNAKGYETDTATTIAEATEAFARITYHVAVLDYYLPDGQGDSLLQRIRAVHPDCVCIMMTTDPNPQLALDWMKQGAAAYIRKPLEPKYLLEICARARRERSLLRVEELLEVRTRQLRESEDQHREFTDTLPLAVFEADDRGNLLFVNRCAFTMFGFDPEDFSPGTLHVLQMIAPLDIDRARANFGRALAQDNSPPAEYLARRRDGSTFPVLVQSQRILHQGARVRVRGIMMDISERKRAENELAQSQRMLRNIIDTIPVRVFWKDLQCRYLGCNRLFAQDAGESDPQALIGKDDFSMGWTDQAEAYRADDLQVMQSGRAKIHYEESQTTPDGRTLWLRTSKIPLRDEEGSIYGVLGAYEDITDQKRADEMLRQSEISLQRNIELISTLLENLTIGVFMVEAPSGRPLIANKAAKRLLGRGILPEASRENLSEVYLARKHGQGTPYPAEEMPIVRGMHGESAHVDDLIVERPDGSEIHLEIWGSPIRDDQEEIWASLVSFQDITKRKQAEEERERLVEQLNHAQKMESIGRLAGGVAHDFNNMLSVILGRTEMGLERVDPGLPLHADLMAVRKAAEHSADITRQLLAFARKQTVAPRELDLNETVESMLKMLRRLIGEDIDLTWIPGTHLESVLMDPSQLDQILVNLCVNARDAITNLGKITIETGMVTFDAAYCAAHVGFVEGEYVLLAVTDDGCGMDKEILANIFEPFFTTKEVGKGTGLGLATVYGIVRQNNGFINVYSEPGQGTRFTIYLRPCPGRAKQSGPQMIREEAVAHGRETILLVEDEPAILEMVAMMLEYQGYTVLAASLPGEAIRMAESHPGRIDLLMTDVVMPEMNGRDLARNLLSMYPNLKRLFMSGYTANVIAHHGVLDAGVHFIQKPFSMQKLAVTIRTVLDQEE